MITSHADFDIRFAFIRSYKNQRSYVSLPSFIKFREFEPSRTEK